MSIAAIWSSGSVVVAYGAASAPGDRQPGRHLDARPGAVGHVHRVLDRPGRPLPRGRWHRVVPARRLDLRAPRLGDQPGVRAQRPRHRPGQCHAETRLLRRAPRRRSAAPPRRRCRPPRPPWRPAPRPGAGPGVVPGRSRPPGRASGPVSPIAGVASSIARSFGTTDRMPGIPAIELISAEHPHTRQGAARTHVARRATAHPGDRRRPTPRYGSAVPVIGSSPSLLQRELQCSQPVVQPRLHRSLRYVELCRDVGHRPTAVVRMHQYDAMLVGQLGQRVRHQPLVQHLVGLVAGGPFRDLVAAQLPLGARCAAGRSPGSGPP